MFKTYAGRVGLAKKDVAFLRPETAQGIFVNFKNVVDSTSRSRPVWHRSNRQELSERNHASEFHVPLARV